jgi:Na+/proline symporter
MALAGIDWLILVIFFAAIIAIGLIVSKTAGRSSAEFFLGGRSMPWWLLGVSMVACTFSCDTPNLVTGMVRGEGVVANWGWWAFLITGMVTVFIYAQLWRRSQVMTDLEFYELRYSGKSAAFIRGFRSLYLGIFFNCLIMGTVTLAAIKIGQVIFDVKPWVAVVVGSAGVVIYATAGGIKSCIWADFFQYSVAMFGAVYAAVIACKQPEVGGLHALLAHPDVAGRLNWMPDFSNWLAWVPLLLIPVAVQWWSVWYPGAEPGGGGYIAQRMLAAKDEKNAIGATLFFNFMHYAMRPWPWIIVALASIVVYPSLESIKSEFPGIDPTYLRHDIAYPVMISKLGPGLLGLVVASLIAAYMSTIGTHLNWGASYVVNDWYKRFMKPNASEKELVLAGRICTVMLMVIAGFLALTFLEDANQAFEILLLSGAGTGAIYLLRWFWWRINAWTEIIAMVAATIMACWVVLWVGDKGTIKWYVDSSIVQDRVFAIDDVQTVNFVKTRQQEYQNRIDEVQTELETLVQVWRRAKEQGPEARDAARARYDATLQELEQLRAAASVPVLVAAMTGKPWQDKLDAFVQAQRAAELERENKRRARLGLLEAATAEEIAVSFDGVVKGNTLYIFHPDLNKLKFSAQLLACVGVVTAVWLAATFLTRPVDKETLRNFYRLCHPGGPGWRKVVLEARAEGVEIDQKNAIGDWKMPYQILCVFLGCVVIYSSLFAVGNFVYGNLMWGFVLSGVALIATIVLFKSLGKIGIETLAEKAEDI